MTTPLAVEETDRADEDGSQSADMAAEKESTTWLVRHMERGAIEASEVQRPVVFHDPYMTLDEHLGEVEPTLGSAVARLAGGRPVEVGPDLVLARYDHLAERVDLRLSPLPARQATSGPKTVRTIGREAVVARFAEALEQLRPAANRLIAGSPRLAPLASAAQPWAVDSRFADLDALMAEHAVDAVLATSPINIEELTAQPERGGAALCRQGDSEVRLYGTVDAALDALSGLGAGRVLIEQHHLPIGQAMALRRAGLTLVPGSDALSKWRERRDHQYLPALVLVTSASAYALERAVSRTRERIKAGEAVSELDTQRAYLDEARAFAAGLGLPGCIQEFFSNCHAGTRTLHPSLASSHALNADTTSLKLDAGLAVVVDGLTLATSDVARTYVGDDDAEAAYRLFQRVVRETITDVIRPGVGFADIHRHVVDRLLGERASLEQAGHWPAGVDLPVRYAMRNVGHLMGRQESFSSEFRPGDREVLRVGDYGACEIQWPLGAHAIGAEDMWLLTPTGTVLLTDRES
ncbi:M24 family metallopeptidase [Streptomyces sulphureus]|uniref:M24 family metallopeptidase n=1 Tax=Streptomyces sulphureus TaxID=47758 RepID=UPI0003A86F36|nr:M24 family metallopeptidase [Streptomyces sulphureus]